jgi:ADP-ribose pyrophosphatase
MGYVMIKKSGGIVMNQMPQRLERTVIYESDYVCLYADKVRLPSGNIIEKYHQIHYPKEAVVVVIFNQQRDILFIHNRRYTIGQLEWEIPAGKMDPGETPETAARREAKEETGCELLDLTYLCSQNPANGMSDALVHVFAATVDTESDILDTDEISEKRWFSEAEYLELLRTNGTKDGVSMLAILYALQFYRK